MKKLIPLVLFIFLSNIALAYEEFPRLNPAVNDNFGEKILILSNGNYVISAYNSSLYGSIGGGAVYLYDGKTHKIISVLYGRRTNDWVGMNIVGLPNGNFVVISWNWHNEWGRSVGAVTWCDGIKGRNGPVTEFNSLVGKKDADYVGNGGITVLANSNYIVKSNYWNNGNIQAAGALTWVDGTKGKLGAVAVENSLVGLTDKAMVGKLQVIPLANGNYLVRDSSYVRDGQIKAGAILWCDGTKSFSGQMTPQNSLVGKNIEDNIGSGGIITLPNGNYVVLSPSWGPDNSGPYGAVTICDGTKGLTGDINSNNSLVGVYPNDMIGSGGVTVLSNGNFVIKSPQVKINSIIGAGAVTFCPKDKILTGNLNLENSLSGIGYQEQIGSGGVYALKNGDYVVCSPYYSIRRGAATLVNGDKGLVGIVNNDNSFIGPTTSSSVGSGGVVELANGAYLVLSRHLSKIGSFNVGAISYRKSKDYTGGVLSDSNSIFGSKANDDIASGGIILLKNGNFLVYSPQYRDFYNRVVGAITLINPNKSIFGYINDSNSLVGNDNLSNFASGGIVPLTNGNFVVNSPNWNHDSLQAVGAVTFCRGDSLNIRKIDTSNSLIGIRSGDRIGSSGVFALANGNYVVASPFWDKDTLKDIGAATLCDGISGRVGKVNEKNSLIGNKAFDSVALGGVETFPDGNYLVLSDVFKGNYERLVAAVTICNGKSGLIDTISWANSLIGSLSFVRSLKPIVKDSIPNHFFVTFSSWCSNDTRTFYDRSDGVRPAPTKQACNLKVLDLNKKKATISWERGDGDYVLLAATENKFDDNSFKNGKTYLPNPEYTLSKTENSLAILYNGRDTMPTVEITNLPLDKSLTFKAFEYNDYYYPLYLTKDTVFNPINITTSKILTTELITQLPYPNPSNKFITIKFKRAIALNPEIKVYNYSGEIVKIYKEIDINPIDNTIKLNIEDLQSGSYWLVLSVENEITTYPINVSK